jgi:D-serine deaminase-like pyridoxal phosphate-dependent protein
MKTTNTPSPTWFLADPWSIVGSERILTPALIIYPDIVDTNIARMHDLLHGQLERWRPHLKTAKLEVTIKQLILRGVRRFKCATTLELLVACKAGAEDVLVAYPSVGSRSRRIREIASEYSWVRVSVIVENQRELEDWTDTKVDIFIDVNPGMDRTGIGQWRTNDIVELSRSIETRGRRFAGIHYYDGHQRHPDIGKRTAAAYLGYEQLLNVAAALRAAKIEVPEIITSGTPALPCALTFPGFKTGKFVHSVSAGTVVYNDTTSLSQLPAEWGFQPAVHVLTTVVSHPSAEVITCDAGHKSLSADAGLPNCMVIGRPELEPLHPSEEHLPIRVPVGAAVPEIGQLLHLVPRHVCPTVNNFDHALLIRRGNVIDAVAVSARGREAPLSGV